MLVRGCARISACFDNVTRSFRVVVVAGVQEKGLQIDPQHKKERYTAATDVILRRKKSKAVIRVESHVIRR